MTQNINYQLLETPYGLMDGQPQEWLHRHSMHCWAELMVVWSSVELRMCLQMIEVVEDTSSGGEEEVTMLGWEWQKGETSSWSR